MESINVTPTIFCIAISISVAQQRYADEEYWLHFYNSSTQPVHSKHNPKAVYGLKKHPKELEIL